MYKIYADDTLIYDSTIEDYKIGKGSVTLETDKSGSFVFSVYPDHPFYEKFVRLKTVITVYKSGRIVFRGRILNDVTDYWNNKVITCEGELGFLQDSITRPFSFTGTPEELFTKFIEEHNSQVDEFKRFKIGTVTVVDANDYVNRSATDYGNTLSTLTSATTGSALGGHIYITHGNDGTDPIPTIHYLADFETVASQAIEFGSNLKNYTKTVKAEDIATAIIPLGTTNSSGGGRLTIKDVNGGADYIYDETAVAFRGWIFKTVVWEDVTLANNLLTKAREYLTSVVNQNITVELNAIDLHLLDRSIESFRVCEYVRVRSVPHNLDATLLCNKQTLDLLKPENDTIVLGYQTTSFTGSSTQMAASVSSLGNEMSSIKQDASSIKLTVEKQDEGISTLSQTVSGFETRIETVEGNVSTLSQTVDGFNTRIETAEGNVSTLSQTVGGFDTRIETAEGNVSTLSQTVSGFEAQVSSNTTGLSQTVRLAADGVTITNAEGSTLEIDGGQLKANSVTATQINADNLKVKAANITGTITAKKLKGKTIDIGDANGNVTATMTPGYSDGDGLDISAEGTLFLHSDEEVVLNTTGDIVISCGSEDYQGDLYPSGFSPNLGYAEGLWKAVWAESGTIQTSDRNRKHAIEDLPEKYITMLDMIIPKRFKLNDGTSDRYHVGFIAQEVEEAMSAAGIDSREFGGLVKDTDKDGNTIYMLRYGEFDGIYAAKLLNLEKRLRALEAKV